jgi:ubiquinone/menaquinone biosynthesis C-methylase UbiE
MVIFLQKSIFVSKKTKTINQDARVKNIFDKIYPLLARQILSDYRITTGTCLHVGSGLERLGIELTKLTSLDVYLLDINSQAITVASKNIWARGTLNGVSAVQGSIQKLPFANNSVNLVVSRGYIFFWKDKSQGVREIYRILKSGGIGFIGGGVSRYLSQKERKIFTQWREGELAENREKGK